MHAMPGWRHADLAGTDIARNSNVLPTCTAVHICEEEFGHIFMPTALSCNAMESGSQLLLRRPSCIADQAAMTDLLGH